jgi:hypothetical protein
MMQPLENSTDDVYRLLAMSVDVVHASAMIVWGAGLPLLVWHHYRTLSRLYTWFAAAFVIISVASQWALGECFLTRAARELWLRSSDFREGVPFTVLFANTVAGIRPTTRTAVLLWEAAVLVTSAGSLWSLYRHARHEDRHGDERGSAQRPRAPHDRQEC